MYRFYQKLADNKICLSYLGAFNDEITDKLIGLSEHYLEHADQLSKLKNKVSYLIAECFQNVVRHGGAKDKEKLSVSNHKDFFQINVVADRIALSSSNLIADKYVCELESKISRVNALDAEQLKKLYNEVIQHQEFSNKGGAGLGLIDMARKSGLPLKSLFNPTTAGNFEFFLGLEIISDKKNLEPKISIRSVKEFYNELREKNVLILYKGDFSKEAISSLIEMLQNNFVDAEGTSSKKMKSIITLIEVLQNASKHAKTITGLKEGVFCIGYEDENFVIECGNFIKKEDQSTFQNNLKDIQAASAEEIIKRYREKLLSPEISTEGNCGLGLLEIARNSAGNFFYDFTETPEQENFFSIKIIV